MNRMLLVFARLLFGVVGLASAPSADDGTLFFIQVSDTHWGFNNAEVNPDHTGILKEGIAEINSLHGNPDFLIFTGDETHTTPDPALRRERMEQFKDIITDLNVKMIKLIPGEHDAALGNAKAHHECFGEPHYSLDPKGVHFIVFDNVSTPDGSQALALLKPFNSVKLFHGHIHQERTDGEDGFTRYAAPGMMFPLPSQRSRCAKWALFVLWRQYEGNGATPRPPGHPPRSGYFLSKRATSAFLPSFLQIRSASAYSPRHSRARATTD